jgi:LmbE family N-acetylglucosaminyl deacetylase/SAM-dependent methyltransferase
MPARPPAGSPPASTSLPTVSSVLAVCAHPDDESFGLGAILDRFVSDGAEVSVLCFTHGGASSLGVSAGELRHIRAAELAAAATALGVARLRLLDHPDGALGSVPLEELAAQVTAMAEEAAADLLVVFDEGGITGHPDHCRATQAALAGAPGPPALAWSLPRRVADALNGGLGTEFVGREDDEIDFVVRVDRESQRRAIACHATQSSDNPVLSRRLELLSDREYLRWLRPPTAGDVAPTQRGVSSRGRSSRAADRRAAIGQDWDRRYLSAPRVFRPEPDETLVELVSPLVPGRTVDLGSGEGRNSLWLARRGWQVVAVDASKVALGRLAESASAEHLAVEGVQEELMSYLDSARVRADTFDLVVLAFVHPEPGELATMLGAAAAVVAPGGHLFVVGHHQRSLGVSGPPDPARLYSEEDLAEGVSGLDILGLEQRPGASDVTEPGIDVWVWARRPAVEDPGGPRPVRPAS